LPDLSLLRCHLALVTLADAEVSRDAGCHETLMGLRHYSSKRARPLHSRYPPPQRRARQEPPPMINRRRTLGGLLAATAALPSPRLARAQAFPNRPLRLIAPYPPGGGIDSVARLLAAPMSDMLGQGVVVENRAGAGGSIGAAAAALIDAGAAAAVGVAAGGGGGAPLLASVPPASNRW
jgi:hypothetical protein